jgi:pilus assembly protein FimV
MRDKRLLCRAVFAAAASWGALGHAAGLGPVVVQSRLGQPLLLEIPLGDISGGHIGAECVGATVALAGGTRLTAVPSITRNGTSIRLATRESVSEPVVEVAVSVACGLSLQRRYRVLVDPELAAPVVETPAADSAGTPAKPAPSARAKPQPAAGAPAAAAKPQAAPAAPVPSAAPAAAPVAPPAAPARPQEQAPLNVLKLSADVNPDEQPRATLALKLSSTLSQPSTETDVRKLAVMQEEQRRFAALLRDEDPAAAAEAGLKAALAKNAAFEAEVARLKLQNQADLANAESERRKMYSGTWITALLLVLFGFAAATVTLMRRMAAIRKELRIDAWSRTVAAVPDMMDGTGAANEASLRPPPAAAAAAHDEDDSEADSANQPPAAVPSATEEPHPAAPFRYSARSVVPGAPVSPGEARRLKVEEISDAVQLAEAWMSFHHPYKMLEILAPFKDVEQPESPIPWLCLLDVHRVMGDREKYEAVQKRIKKIYNVKMPPWETSFGDEPLKTLDDFPHIVDRIFDLWDSEQIVPYLDSLLHDQRDGEREGFDLPVYRNILQLISLASEPDPRKRHNHITHGKAYDILFCPIVPKTGPGSAGADVHEPATPELREEFASAPAHDVTHGPVRTEPAPATVHQALQQATQPQADSTPLLAAASTATHKPAGFGGDDEMSDIAIKLHLALAYQDIGDEEGARILIEEVIRHGNPEQVLKARLLLTKLN